jgi:hypothetical protein
MRTVTMVLQFAMYWKMKYAHIELASNSLLKVGLIVLGVRTVGFTVYKSRRNASTSHLTPAYVIASHLSGDDIIR